MSLKIAQWCGFSYSTTEIASFITAADLGVDVVNISFGGYLDRSDPEQELIYQAYIDAVAYARSKGTIIVAAAGNEHLRVGPGGRVISHGQLSTPGDPAEDWPDLFGMYEVPGGIPGVVDVSSTGRRVVPSSATCPPGTIGDPGDPTADPPVPPDFNATCKPITDRHQAAGQGRQNQLAYYSNYGPRIDIAGPGGPASSTWPTSTGRHPRVPLHHRRPDQRLGGLQHHLQLGDPDPLLPVQLGGRLPRRPVLHDHPGHLHGRPARGRLPGPGRQRPPGAAQAPAGADRPAQADGQRQPAQLHAGPVGTDTSPGDLTGLPCDIGYCHLEGPTISDNDAYGAGLVNVANP